MTKIILTLTFFLVSSVAYARTIRVSDCIITIGRFCVIESFLAVVFGFLLIFYAIIKSYETKKILTKININNDKNLFSIYYILITKLIKIEITNLVI